jgi:hypothetical protein
MAMLLNIGASVTNVFGPLILSGLGYKRSIPWAFSSSLRKRAVDISVSKRQ